MPAQPQASSLPARRIGRGAPAPDLSVVIPVHDEEGAIVPLVEETASVLRGLVEFELVVVDDGSRDATAQRLAEARSRVAELRVVAGRRRAGQSAAIAAGVAAARGGWIATMDGDGQNDPSDLPALVERARRAGARTMVCGERTRRRDSSVRRLASRIANRTRSGFLGDGIADTGCGLKVMPRRLYVSLPAFDHMHRFLPALALARGFEVVTVPVGHRPRRRGRSKYGILDRLVAGVVDLLGVRWLTWRSLPDPPIEGLAEGAPVAPPVEVGESRRVGP